MLLKNILLPPTMNSYSCPKCSAQFPLFIRPSMTIRRGLLVPYLKCANCGQISRGKINYFSAIWIWPLTISAFAGIYILRSSVNLPESFSCFFPSFCVYLHRGSFLIYCKDSVVYSTGGATFQVSTKFSITSPRS